MPKRKLYYTRIYRIVQLWKINGETEPFLHAKVQPLGDPTFSQYIEYPTYQHFLSGVLCVVLSGKHQGATLTIPTCRLQVLPQRTVCHCPILPFPHNETQECQDVY